MIPVLINPINLVIPNIITEEIPTLPMIPIPHPKVPILQIPICHPIDQPLPSLGVLISLIVNNNKDQRYYRWS